MSLSLEQRVRAEFLALPYRQLGTCTCCGRNRSEDDRPLLVAGRVHGALVCIACFDLRGAPARRK